MVTIGECIYLAASNFEKSADKIRKMVTDITEKFPLYE
jgi:hypothetical protein